LNEHYLGFVDLFHDWQQLVVRVTFAPTQFSPRKSGSRLLKTIC